MASRSVPPTYADQLNPHGGHPTAVRHFRAYERRITRLSVEVAASPLQTRSATVVNVSLAGACLETDDVLTPNDRVSITIATPTMWDPLEIDGTVVWSAIVPSTEQGALGRLRTVARAGIRFEYRAPSGVFAVFELLATLGYDDDNDHRDDNT